MLNSELYDRILRRARRPGDQVLREAAQEELKEILQSWEKSPFLPWFLETKNTLQVGSMETTMLEDYLLLVEDTKPYYMNSSGGKIFLHRGYHEDIEVKYLNVDEGPPLVYDIFGGSFYVGPAPDQEYTVHLKYLASTTPPPDDGEEVTNPWVLNARDLVITAVAARLADDYIKNTELADRLTHRAASLRSELHKYNEARKHVDMDYEVDR